MMLYFSFLIPVMKSMSSWVVVVVLAFTPSTHVEFKASLVYSKFQHSKGYTEIVLENKQTKNKKGKVCHSHWYYKPAPFLLYFHHTSSSVLSDCRLPLTSVIKSLGW